MRLGGCWWRGCGGGGRRWDGIRLFERWLDPTLSALEKDEERQQQDCDLRLRRVTKEGVNYTRVRLGRNPKEVMFARTLKAPACEKGGISDRPR